MLDHKGSYCEKQNCETQRPHSVPPPPPPSHLLYCAVSLSPKNTLLSPTQFLVELHTESRKCCAFVATDIFDVTNVVNTGF